MSLDDRGRSSVLEPRKDRTPDLSDDMIIDELNDAIEYLSDNTEEIEGLETTDGSYLVSVPEIVEHTDIYERVESVDDELMEEIDEYAHWIAREGGFKNIDRVNRYKRDFENDCFGRKYWHHQKRNSDTVYDLTVGEGVEMPHFKVHGAEEVIENY